MLSQAELAQLLGVKQSRVSQYEQGSYPPLLVALAYQVVFGKKLHVCFSDLYAEIEENVINRAVELDRAVRGKRDRISVRKQELLTTIVGRATSRQAA